MSVCCPGSVRIFCQVSVCPDSVCLDFVSCPDSVQIFRKNAVLCLSVRIFFVSILSAVGILSGFFEKKAVRCLSIRISFKNSLSSSCLDIFCITSIDMNQSLSKCTQTNVYPNVENKKFENADTDAYDFLDFGHGLGQSHDFGHGLGFRHGHVRKPRTRVWTRT